jgi:hypothetical protein
LRRLAEKHAEMTKHVAFVGSVTTLLEGMTKTGFFEEIEAAEPLKLDAKEKLERIRELSDEMIQLLTKENP